MIPEAGSCRETGFDCYSQIRRSYLLNLRNGWLLEDGTSLSLSLSLSISLCIHMYIYIYTHMYYYYIYIYYDNNNTY